MTLLPYYSKEANTKMGKTTNLNIAKATNAIRQKCQDPKMATELNLIAAKRQERALKKAAGVRARDAQARLAHTCGRYFTFISFRHTFWWCNSDDTSTRPYRDLTALSQITNYPRAWRI
jgi:hypothetical protein